jgi:putative membrane protein
MMWHNGWMSWNSGGGFGAMWIGPIFLVVILAAAVWAVSAFTSKGRGGRRLPSPDRTPPREILDERFARGEIDEEEYRRRRDALKS